jgi:hypothetical protein
LFKFYKSCCDIKYSWADDEDLRVCDDFRNLEFVICTNIELVNQSDYQGATEGILNSDGACFLSTPILIMIYIVI